jgi:transcriptional regulator with XRE-family HTH domain
MGMEKSLRDILKEQGWTDSDFAEAMGVQRPRVHEILRAPDLKLSTSLRICRILKISLKELARSKNLPIDGVPDDFEEDMQ